MKLGTFLGVTAIIAVLFGVAFVLAPGMTISLYGGTLEPVGALVAQLFGAELLGFACLNWLARNAQEGEALRAIVTANLLSHTIGFVFALLSQLSGAVNALGWSTVLVYLLLALGFGYFQFVKPVAQAGSTQANPT